MNVGSTMGTALLRGLYVAFVAGGLAFLTAWQQTDDAKGSAITGGIAFLGALGIRGGLEGTLDAGRQRAGDVKASDVQPVGQGQA